MSYLKPQSPLQMGANFIYPLTTADQIIMNDDSRLSASKVLVPDTTLTIEGGGG